MTTDKARQLNFAMFEAFQANGDRWFNTGHGDMWVRAGLAGSISPAESVDDVLPIAEKLLFPFYHLHVEGADNGDGGLLYAVHGATETCWTRVAYGESLTEALCNLCLAVKEPEKPNV